jgi:hypothetical protein
MAHMSDGDKQVFIMQGGLLLLGAFTWIRHTLAVIGLLTSLFVLFSFRSSEGFLKLSVGRAKPSPASSGGPSENHQKTGGFLTYPIDLQ